MTDPDKINPARKMDWDTLGIWNGGVEARMGLVGKALYFGDLSVLEMSPLSSDGFQRSVIPSFLARSIPTQACNNFDPIVKKH